MWGAVNIFEVLGRIDLKHPRSLMLYSLSAPPPWAGRPEWEPRFSGWQAEEEVEDSWSGSVHCTSMRKTEAFFDEKDIDVCQY